VLLPGGHDAAGPDHMEAVRDGLLETADHLRLLQDITGMLGALERLVRELAGSHHAQLGEAEVGHGPGDRSHVPIDPRFHQNDLDLRHGIRDGSLVYLFILPHRKSI